MGISVVGLGFAIVQLLKLRGETRAAKDAAEATQRAIGRELAFTELIRLNGKIRELKEIHREGNRTRALVQYSDILESFLDVRKRHPGLSKEQRVKILEATTRIAEMETTVGSSKGEIALEIGNEFNDTLTEFQLGLLPELEDQLQNLG